jgi:hypothetical protein
MSPTKHPPVTFPLGQLVVTANAARRLTLRAIDEGVRRHARGDWGELGPQDAAENGRALGSGGRLFSAYGAGDGRFWVITEADRSATTVLLPQDY